MDTMRNVHKLAILALLCLAWGGVKADTYNWVGPSGTLSSYSSLNNWTVNGATPARLPGEDDKFKDPMRMWADLDGKEWTIGEYNDCATWDFLGFRHLTNGILKVKTKAEWHGTSNDSDRSTTLYANSILEMMPDSTFIPGQNDAAKHYLNVLDGACLNVYGILQIYNFGLKVYAGGVANLSPSSFELIAGTAQDSYLQNEGRMIFNNGVVINQGSSSGGQLRIIQNDGVMTLGGPVDKNGQEGTYSFTIKGGTVKAIADVAFDFGTLSIPANSQVNFEVAEGKTCDISNFTVDNGVVVTKQGSGKLVVPEMNVTIEAGEIEAPTFGALTFAGGSVTLMADANGVQSVPAVTVVGSSKVRLVLPSLTTLPDGTYPIVEDCGELTFEDFDVTCDAKVNAEVSLESGVLKLTKNGLADAAPNVWNPMAGDTNWTGANWSVEEEQSSWENGAVARFSGTEDNYQQVVHIDTDVIAGKVIVEGERDYQFSGNLISTLDFTKQGTGMLVLNNKGVSGCAVKLNGGTLAFGAHSSEFVSEPVEVIVAENAEVAVKGETITEKAWRDHLVVLRYIERTRLDNSSYSWSNYPIEQFPNSISLNGISSLMRHSPSLPDGSGNGMAGLVCVFTGKFYVPEDMAGEWSFWGCYDDMVSLRIGDDLLLETSAWNEEKSVSTTLRAGWHNYEIRTCDNGTAFNTSGYGMEGGWLKFKTPGASDFVVFSENNLTLSVVGDEIETLAPPDKIALKLNLGAGANFMIGSVGLELADDSSIAEDATVRIDYAAIPTHTTFVKCSGDVKTALMAKIAETMAADLGTIEGLGALGDVVGTEDGIAWEMKAVFYGGDNSDITDLLDPDGWRGPVAAPEGESVTIAANAVMSGETPAYGSVLVSGGATLAVNATREVNKVTLAAGTTLAVAKDGDVANTVTVADSLITTGAGSVTVDVAEGCVLDLRGITLTLAAKLVKIGAGVIIFDQTELANIKIASGAVAFPAMTAMDMSEVDLEADGLQIMVINGAGALRPATAVVDGGLTTYYAPGRYVGTGLWSDVNNWEGQVLPDASDYVYVASGASLTLDGLEAMPRAIVVEDNATFIVKTAVTLPPMTLAPTANLTLGDGENEMGIAMYDTPVAEYRLNGEQVSIPKFTVADKTTVTVAMNAKFKNVDMDIEGQICTPSGTKSNLYLGYAEAGETTYFGLRVANGGFINPQGSTATYGTCQTIVAIADAEPDGTVVVPNTIRVENVKTGTKFGIKNSAFFPRNYVRLTIGKAWAVSTPIDVVFDNSEVYFEEYFFLRGATTLTLRNKSLLRKSEQGSSWGVLKVGHASKIVVENECQLLMYRLIGHNNDDWSIDFYENSDNGEPSLVLKSGAKVLTHNVNGHYKAKIRVEGDSEMFFYRSSKTDTGHMNVITPSSDVALYQMKALEIVDGATLTLGWSDKGTQTTDNVIPSSIKVTGGGNLVVSNKKANQPFTLVMRGDSSGSAGDISVAPETRTTLAFANGANWGGTVVADEAVTFGGAVPATVTINELKLTGAMKLRVWKDGGGVVTNDKLNLTSCVNAGGRIVFDPQDDAELMKADWFIIGSLPKSENLVLPKLQRGWQAVAVDDPEDEDRVLIRAEAKAGFTVILQ